MFFTITIITQTKLLAAVVNSTNDYFAMATDRSVLKFYITSAKVFGVCPCYLKPNCWKTVSGKIYATILFFIIIFITLFFGHNKLIEDNDNYNFVEKIVNFCEFLSLVGIYLSLLNSNVRKHLSWKKLFKNLDDFDRRCFRKTTIKETATRNLDGIYYSHDFTLVESCYVDQWKIKNEKNAELTYEYGTKYQRRPNIYYEIVKFCLLHIIMPFEYLADCMMFRSNVSVYTLFLVIPYHIGLHYTVLVAGYLYELSNVLVVRYEILQNILTKIMKEHSIHSDSTARRFSHLKVYYNRMYQCVECLGNIFGLSLLVIFINLETNILFYVYRSSIFTTTDVKVIIFRTSQFLISIVSMKSVQLFCVCKIY